MKLETNHIGKQHDKTQNKLTTNNEGIFYSANHQGVAKAPAQLECAGAFNYLRSTFQSHIDASAASTILGSDISLMLTGIVPKSAP